ncbi:hypothetical protein EDB81DRAFT_808418 [Dactylonectria macrodidyma]|uniref:Ester cyclase n=1 Tax=Dactylonectria macrodidyma TaxID=307937 RepID=A0A9P9E1B6_9HYPO|nr:hypothetical protein EDB81DRAFT_808418 [Dactylonectria macrodidyma]
MSTQQTLDRFIDFINSGDRTLGQQIIDESAEFHVPFDSKPLKGLDGYMEILSMMRGAFPDIQWTLEETVCEGDRVVARFTTRGTQNGPFLGFAPSGKNIEMTAMNLYRIADGKIVEERGLPDLFGLMVQTGAVKIRFP